MSAADMSVQGRGHDHAARKCGARIALHPPELARTPLPGYSFTEPPWTAQRECTHSAAVTAALSRDAIPSSQHSQSRTGLALPSYSFSSKAESQLFLQHSRYWSLCSHAQTLQAAMNLPPDFFSTKNRENCHTEAIINTAMTVLQIP